MGWANAAIGFVWTVKLVRVTPCRRMFSIQITELANAEAAVAHTSARSMIGHGMRQGCGSMSCDSVFAPGKKFAKTKKRPLSERRVEMNQNDAITCNWTIAVKIQNGPQL